MKSTISGLLILLTAWLMPMAAHAEEAPAPAATTPQYTYYTLAPDITTNYFTQGSRIGYLRLQVDLMLANPADIKEVEHHAPLIRDAIINIIAQQPEARVKSLAGREDIRQACFNKVNELLITETKKKLLTELLFTEYLYQ
ncbi:flagellar basal body-associated protein FliL [Photobacterium nomapromontoriensis]